MVKYISRLETGQGNTVQQSLMPGGKIYPQILDFKIMSFIYFWLKVDVHQKYVQHILYKKKIL